MSISVSNSSYKPALSGQTTQLHRVPASHGIQWIKQSWHLFKSNPWLLLAWGLTCIAISTLVHFAPPSSVFLTPFMVAGFVMAAARLDNGEQLPFQALFTPFNSHLMPVLTLGLIVLIASVISAAILGVGLGVAMTAMESKNTVILAIAALIMSLGGVLLGLAVLSVAHAPCLVCMLDTPPKQAFKLAIKALFVNWKAMTVYGLTLFGLYLLAIIPAGLGLFILLPVTLVSTYTSFKDMFYQQ